MDAHTLEGDSRHGDIHAEDNPIEGSFAVRTVAEEVGIVGSGSSVQNIAALGDLGIVGLARRSIVDYFHTVAVRCMFAVQDPAR